MIIGALQEFPPIPANANGSEAKEPDKDSAFAALLLAVFAPAQIGGAVPAGESADGTSVENSPAGARENGSVILVSSAAQTPSVTAAGPSLDPAQIAASTESTENSSATPAVPQQTVDAAKVAPQIPAGFNFSLDGQLPVDSNQTTETAAVTPSDSTPVPTSVGVSAEIPTPLGPNESEDTPVAPAFEKTGPTAGESQAPSKDNPSAKDAAQALATPVTNDVNPQVLAPASEAGQTSFALQTGDGAASEGIESRVLASDQNKVISSAAPPQPGASVKRDTVAPVQTARAETIFTGQSSLHVANDDEVPPASKSEQNRGPEQKSIQGRVDETFDMLVNNTASGHSGSEQKSFSHDPRALPALPDEKNPPAKDAGLPSGFTLEPTVAGRETQSRIEAEPAAWRPTLERLADDIASQVRIGARDATIQLDPPELGKIKIDLRMDGDKLLAHITTDSPEAQSLLRNHLPELHQALQSQQVNLAEVRVWNGSGSGAAGDFAQNFHQAPGQRQPGGWPGGSSQGERGAANEPPRMQRFLNGSGRVSVWA